jgi:hypothetical protein
MTDCCLHCAIMASIEDWAGEHGKRVGSKIVIDSSDIIAKLAECIVDVAAGAPTAKDRVDGVKFAHAAIDAIEAAGDKPVDGVNIQMPVEH